MISYQGKEYFGIVYKVTNNITGKVYIGQTVRGLTSRRREHLSDTRRKKYVSYFHKAIRKYGEEVFDWDVIEYCYSKEEMDGMEFHYIMQYKSFKPNGYNLTFGGGGVVGYVCSKETRRKKSIAKMGDKNPAKRSEVREKMSRNHADFSGENNPNYGKPRPEETRRKITRTLTGRYVGEKHVLAKKYVIITPEREEFVVHGLVNFCRNYKKVKLSGAHLSNCAVGTRKHNKGYKCRYYNEITDKNIPQLKKLGEEK